jgi:hypothetical protein
LAESKARFAPEVLVSGENGSGAFEAPAEVLTRYFHKPGVEKNQAE